MSARSTMASTRTESCLSNSASAQTFLTDRDIPNHSTRTGSMRLPYDVLALLPALATSTGDLCSWAQVDRYMHGVASQLLYQCICLDGAWMDKVMQQYPTLVSRTSIGYLLQPSLASQLGLRTLLPLNTLLTHPSLANRVHTFLCVVPSLCGPGVPAFLALLAELLELTPRLRSFGWKCEVRITDGVMRCLPLLRELREVEIRRPSCPLVYGSFGPRRTAVDKWAWEYLASWTEIGTAPALSTLEHLHLSLPQPSTCSLWFTYLSALSLPSPLRSLYISSPGIEDDPLPSHALLEFGMRHAATLEGLGTGAAQIGAGALRGLLEGCKRLKLVEVRGLLSEEGEGDVLWALEKAGPSLELVIVKEDYYTRSSANPSAWEVSAPDWERFERFRKETRMPRWRATRPGWIHENGQD